VDAEIEQYSFRKPIKADIEQYEFRKPFPEFKKK
jgi:hypothetical protein